MSASCLDSGAHLTDREYRFLSTSAFFSPRCTVSCVFLRAAAKRSLLHWRRGVKVNDYIGQYYDKRRWHTSTGSRVCFVWRNEAGGGETAQSRWAPAKHHRILALIRCLRFALHCICCIVEHRFFFSKCMVKMQLVWGHPPLHRSIAAMIGRGLLSTAARPVGEEADWFGTVVRICGCYSVCGACKYNPRKQAVRSLREKRSEKTCLLDLHYRLETTGVLETM